MRVPANPSRRSRGFTYLLLLFAIAIGAAGLAALGERANVATQREREAELMFRGQAIAQALGAYRAATPGPVKNLPASLQDLVEDRRGPRALHHLRRLYPDPFTGKPDWVLLRSEDGRIAGVHSSAAVPALRTLDLPTPPPGQRALVSARDFWASDPSPGPASAVPKGNTVVRTDHAPLPAE
jgi:type II secretory pathway pseudopilin PulG